MLCPNGRLYAWGANGNGQLSTGNTTARNSPVTVALPADMHFAQVAASYYHSLTLAAVAVGVLVQRVHYIYDVLAVPLFA